MRKFIKENKSLFIKLCAIAIISCLLVILGLFTLNKDICEWWSRNVARSYHFAIGSLTKYLPFSLTEFTILILIVSLSILIIWSIVDLCKKRFIKGFSKISSFTIVLLSFITIYVGSTSLGYYRYELPIPLYSEKVNKEEFRPVIEHFINDFNACSNQLTYKDDGAVISPYTEKEIINLIKAEYKDVNDDYFSTFDANPKKFISSPLFREFNITGMWYGPLGEVNYNYLSTTAEIPFVIAHELAHSKGVMRENDAQLMAAYICLNSENQFLRYSGYMCTFYGLFNLASHTGNANDRQELYDMLETNILQNMDQMSTYWAQYNTLDKIADFFNNLYLKIFGNDSTDGYTDLPPVIDPGTEEIISFSRYQKLYFEIYFNSYSN